MQDIITSVREMDNTQFTQYAVTQHSRELGT